MSSTLQSAEAGSTSQFRDLARFDPFRDLPDAVLQSIAEIAELRRYAAGATIAAIGQHDGSEFYLIVAGTLKASKVDAATGAMTIERYAEERMFGLAEAMALGEGWRTESLSLTADPEVDVLAVDADGFRQIVAQRPTLARNLMLHFAAVIADGALQPIAPDRSPEARVFATLLSLIEPVGIGGLSRIAKMPKHRELADRAGVDEAFAAQAVAQLIHDGVARRDYPGLIIEDMERFKRFVG